jgi:hypothetical protein
MSSKSSDKTRRQVKEQRQDATTSGDKSRPVATEIVPDELSEHRRAVATGDDKSRLVATEARYIEHIEKENEFLRGQMDKKDTQIAALLERDHETNSLINGLQRMLAPLLAAPNYRRDDRSVRDEDTSTRGA